jgi:polyketide cyclase/dehydrase/lipid transport protein
MARIVKSVMTSWTTEQAFEYMADFSHAAEWDPGVAESTRVNTGPVGQGSEFDLIVLIAGRRVPMRYAITDFVPGRVTFSSRSAHLESVDTVTVTPHGATTEVTYDARIRFRGVLRIADPLLALAFRGVAERAIGGLKERLTQVG